MTTRHQLLRQAALTRRAGLNLVFRLGERLGVHILPVHFYSPIPHLRTLKTRYPPASELPGVDMRDQAQLDLLRSQLAVHAAEFSPYYRTQAALKATSFNGMDPFIYYAMIRAYQPQQIIEVGGGTSTHVAALAVNHNGSGSIHCIEPYPSAALRALPGIELVRQRAEDTDPALFEQLKANDILFIDSTHTVRIGGDVLHLFLNVLPRLASGVLVHIHDVFLPEPYPPDFVFKRHYFWAEQYLLQAYLIGNAGVEVLFANSYMAYHYEAEVEAALPDAPYYRHSGSFWLRVV